MRKDDQVALPERRVEDLEAWWGQIAQIAGSVSRRFPYMPPKWPHRRRNSNLEEVVILQISDTQCGSRITREETGGIEEYDESVFLRRMLAYQERVAIIVNDVLRSALPVHNCVVVLGGDFIEGELVYRGQQMHVDEPWATQIFRTVHDLAALLQFIAGMFDHVRVETVDGNHGAVYGATLNIDFLCYLFMREILRDQRNIDWRISTGHMNVFEVGPASYNAPRDYPPRTFLAVHGDAIRSSHGTPYCGLDRAYGNYLNALQRHIDTMLVGHFHRAGFGPDLSWAVNGSWPGASGYSLEALRSSCRPQQWLWTCHQGVGITSVRPIYLAARGAPCGSDEQLTPTAPDY